MLFNKPEMLREIKITIGEELRVRRMVVLLVEINEILVLEVGYVLGFATRVELVL